jgi:hypothetical protein
MERGTDPKLLDPGLWRLEIARRRRQLDELRGFLSALEREFQALSESVLAFWSEYEQRLGPLWSELESLQAEVQRTLDAMAAAQGGAPVRLPELRTRRSLPTLPAAVAWPEPPADETAPAAPSLKHLHRLAAMRLHPDRAPSEAERARREALMRDANLAYANQDRTVLEGLLIAAGESPVRLSGFDVHAQWQWLERCEQLAQGRMRLIRAHLVLLRQHPNTVMAEAVTRGRERGLDALALMELRLKAQVQDLRQQHYIGARLAPDSGLAQAFLAQWRARWAEGASVQPSYAPAWTGLKGERAASSAS